MKRKWLCGEIGAGEVLEMKSRNIISENEREVLLQPEVEMLPGYITRAEVGSQELHGRQEQPCSG